MAMNPLLENVLAHETQANVSQSSIYYCRVGRHGQIGKFRDIQRKNRDRDEAVLVRTSRGVEPATILSLASLCSLLVESTDGKILRKQTMEDMLLQKQLLASAQSALTTCQAYLSVHHRSDCLLDVEPLMDGKTLYFHFVGTPDESLSGHLQELAEIFQREVQSSQFAQLLDHGCGPGCGTEEKGGCGESGACTVCVIAKACTSKS